MHEPFSEPQSDWTPTPVSRLPSWQDAKRVAIDVETCDPQLTKLGPGVRRGGYVVGVSFAIEDGPAHYLPIDHEEGENLSSINVWGYLRDQSKCFQGEIVGANLQYDLDYFWENRVHFGQAKFHRDVCVAEPLIDELQFRYSLEEIAKRYGVPGKSEADLLQAANSWGIGPKDLKANLWKLPAKHVAEYAIQDVRLPLALLRRQERKIDDQDLWEVYDLESRLLPILLKMRRRGVRVDEDRFAQVEHMATNRRTEEITTIFFKTGVAIESVWSDDAKKALKVVGIKVEESVDAAFLESCNHPVADAILKARKADKILQFVASIKQHLIRGRIHCTYVQVRGEKMTGGKEGPAYGRCSCKDPNMTQQPKRDSEWGPIWRTIFLPEKGKQWARMDFSQQEPRMTIHYAARLGLPKADLAAQRYWDDPKCDHHQMMADMTNRPRDHAKAIFLGLVYGEGGAKLCKDLGLPTAIRNGYEVAGPEGQAILDGFHEAVPFVRQLSKMVTFRARDLGYVKTLDGRRCRFPEESPGRYKWTWKALNRIIQGSCAGQMKKAMVAVDAAGYGIQLQVHDELDLSVRDRGEARAVADIMEHVVELAVPSRVDVEVGKSWGEAA